MTDFLDFEEELRSAHAEPKLSPSFADDLVEGLQTRWSWQRSMRQNPLMRVAASLLLLAATAVPVAAIVALMQTPELDLPEIGFHVPADVTVDRQLPTQPDVVLPNEPMGDDLVFDEAWAEAVAQQNRFAQAARSWHARFVDSADGAEALVQRQWALEQLARRENNPHALELFQTFEHALDSGDFPLSLPHTKQELIDMLALAPDLGPFLAGWLWVVAAQTPPSGIDVDLNWPTAPWLAELQ